MRHDRHHRPPARMVKGYFDRPCRSRPLDLPLVHSNVHQAASSELLGEMFRNKEDGIYTRFGHPTTAALAEKPAFLEGAASALAFSSGMAAISTSLAPFLRPGDHLVVRALRAALPAAAAAQLCRGRQTGYDQRRPPIR